MVTMLQLAAAALLFSQLLVVYGASNEKEQEVAAVLRRMVRAKCYERKLYDTWIFFG